MKPLARGYTHLLAFFLAIAASILLISQSHGTLEFACTLLYSFTLIGMFGISALFHSPMWSRNNYLLLKRIDHAAIFALIAGTATPICLLGLKEEIGFPILLSMWGFALIGTVLTIFWINSPKWMRGLFYGMIGWLSIPYISEIKYSLGLANFQLLLIGGLIYTLGAIIYALKRPNPFPRVFGYHEVFHVLVVIASGFHFMVVYNLVH